MLPTLLDSGKLVAVNLPDIPPPPNEYLPAGEPLNIFATCPVGNVARPVHIWKEQSLHPQFHHIFVFEPLWEHLL